MTRPISFLHAGGLGDIIYAIPAMLSVLENHRAEKAMLFLELGRETRYSGWHPLGTKLLDADFVNRLVPLLRAQSFIEDVRIYSGGAVDFDLNGFRRLPINPTTYCLPRWYFLFLIGTGWDLSRPWLTVDGDAKFRNHILVSRNPRLRSQFIHYGFMNDFADEIVFVGVRGEFEEFARECPRCTNFYEAPDFLELARVLMGARFFCGNQGFIYTLTEAMKTPRLLETNTRAANNVPTGPNCHDALFQEGFAYWFGALREKYPAAA